MTTYRRKGTIKAISVGSLLEIYHVNALGLPKWLTDAMKRGFLGVDKDSVFTRACRVDNPSHMVLFSEDSDCLWIVASEYFDENYEPVNSNRRTK